MSTRVLHRVFSGVLISGTINRFIEDHFKMKRTELMAREDAGTERAFLALILIFSYLDFQVLFDQGISMHAKKSIVK